MKNLNFDSGVEEYRLQGGGVLRFNPADPNLYARFLEAEGQLKEIEGRLHAQASGMEDTAASVMDLLGQADREVKALLNRVFTGNDFDKALGGVNLLAVAGNGERVVTNLFAALEEILAAGAERFADAQVEKLRAQV